MVVYSGSRDGAQESLACGAAKSLNTVLCVFMTVLYHELVGLLEEEIKVSIFTS